MYGHLKLGSVNRVYFEQEGFFAQTNYKVSVQLVFNVLLRS